MAFFENDASSKVDDIGKKCNLFTFKIFIIKSQTSTFLKSLRLKHSNYHEKISVLKQNLCFNEKCFGSLQLSTQAHI